MLIGCQELDQVPMVFQSHGPEYGRFLLELSLVGTEELLYSNQWLVFLVWISYS